jgi:hypothetical protein
MTVQSDARAVVLAWHAALNAGDVEAVIGLSAAEIEVGGPRGTARGVDVVREWVARAGIRLEPGRMYGSGAGPLVVEQQPAGQPRAAA